MERQKRCYSALSGADSASLWSAILLAATGFACGASEQPDSTPAQDKISGAKLRAPWTQLGQDSHLPGEQGLVSETPPATVQLGLGQGQPDDAGVGDGTDEAIEMWMEIQARQGNPNAQFDLGWLYAKSPK